MDEILERLERRLFKEGYSQYTKKCILDELDELYLDCAITGAEYEYMLRYLVEEMYKMEHGAHQRMYSKKLSKRGEDKMGRVSINVLIKMMCECVR